MKEVRLKTTLKYLFEIIIIIAFLYYYINNQSKFEILSKVSILEIIALLLLQLLTILINSLFFKTIIEIYDVFIGHKDSFYISTLSAIGNFVGVLQSGVGIRAYYLKKKFNLKYKDFTYTFLANYLIVYFVVSIQALIGIYFLYKYLSTDLSYITLFFIAILFVTSIIFFLPILKSERLFNFKYIEKILIFYNNLISGWKKITNNKKILSRLFLLQIISTIIYTFIFWLEFKFIGISIGIPQIMLYSSIISVSTLIAFTPGGIGIRETILILLQTSLSITTAEILNVSLLDRGVYFAMLVFIYILFKMKGINNILTKITNKHA